jgi:hypothetical protein
MLERPIHIPSGPLAVSVPLDIWALDYLRLRWLDLPPNLKVV